jgi:23S rRNA pseudouridine2605 synthase
VPPRTPLRKVGLARALSKLGYCSRSQASSLIREGRVCLNGIIRRDPEWPVHLGLIQSGKDRVEIDGAPLSRTAFQYWMMNKPRGLVTTASDEKGRATIYSLLDPAHSWLAPVGRLDKASEGLLLLTNDSEWGQRVLDPATHLEKTYHVQVNVVADEALLAKLRRGIREDEEGGEPHDRGRLQARRVELLRSGAKNSWLKIVLDEGKNRQIRRMLSACGVEVLRLVRVAIGPLALGDLAKGKARELTLEEKKNLDHALNVT